jgi:hypothetical protein
VAWVCDPGSEAKGLSQLERKCESRRNDKRTVWPGSVIQVQMDAMSGQIGVTKKE